MRTVKRRASPDRKIGKQCEATMFCDDAIGEIFSGYLKKSPPEYKMGQRMCYKTRFFCLRKAEGRDFPVFEYKKKRSSKNIINEIPLGKWTEISAGCTLKGFEDRPTFLLGTAERNYYLMCKTDKEMYNWVNSLRMALSIKSPSVESTYSFPKSASIEEQTLSNAHSMDQLSISDNCSWPRLLGDRDLYSSQKYRRKVSSADVLQSVKTNRHNSVNNEGSDVCHACQLPLKSPDRFSSLLYLQCEKFRSAPCVFNNPPLTVSRSQGFVYPEVHEQTISPTFSPVHYSNKLRSNSRPGEGDSIKSFSTSDYTDSDEAAKPG